MKSFILPLSLLASMITNTVCAQLGGGQAGLPRVNFLSPQTYEFVKYGNTPVAHFTGEANVTIPVYTYADKDFELPIYLGYNSSGFAPGKREGIVGLNWYINSGAGVITRKVNGWPDERTGQPTTIPMELHGLFYGIKNNLQIKSRTKSQMFNPNNGTVNSATLYWHIDGCEADPDDFTFSMPGHSGRFFIENNGNVRTSGNKPFRVDLSGFAIQPAGQTSTVNNSEIIITADNGFKYYFGGTEQYLEISYPLDANYEVGTGFPVIIGWHLKKIEAPNGRTAIYEYEEYDDGMAPHHLGDDHHYLLNIYDIEYAEASSTCNDFAGGMCSYIGSASGIQTVKEVTKTVYLKKITIGNTTIEFEYDEKANRFYASENTEWNQFNFQLSSILVKNDGNVLKQFDFGYAYRGGTHSRLFLTSFGEVGMNPYTFDYYNTNSLPDPRTHGVDHWGFWNEGASNGPLIPAITYYQTGDIEYTGSVRAPGTSSYNTALLKKMTYPTTGFTEFVYQPHAYSKRLERRNSGNFLPQLFSVTGNAGGARISSIKDHDGERYVNERVFEYVKDYPAGGTQSSGILLSWPRYLFYWKYDDGFTVQHVLRKKSTSFNVNYYPGESFIQYSEVTEVVNPSNGYTRYKFTNYETHPDVNDYLTSVVSQSTQLYITNLNLYNNFIGIKFNERSADRGLPAEVTTYASRAGGGSYAVKKSVTTFTGKDDNPNHYVVGVHQTGGIAQSFKLYYHAVQPSEVTETVYSAEGVNSTSTVSTCSYNADSYLYTKTVTQSNGNSQAVKMKYPSDLITTADEALLYSGSTPTAVYSALPAEVKALADLKKNNMLSQPVEIITTLNGDVTTSNYIEYKDFANANFSTRVYPHKNWILKTGQPLTAFQEAYISKVSPWTLIKHSGYGTNPEATFDQYDNVGNLLQTTEKGRLKKAYQWGYNNIYPIAEATGIGYNQFFFTGFEDSEGNTTTSFRTGQKSRADGYTKTLNDLTPGNYTLGYWKKLANGTWSLDKQPVNVTGTSYTISIPGTLQIDDLRFHPDTPLMQLNTYTYQPLTGISSRTDTNNKTEYFEFDDQERLKLTRDHTRSISKTIGYQFKIN